MSIKKAKLAALCVPLLYRPTVVGIKHTILGYRNRASTSQIVSDYLKDFSITWQPLILVRLTTNSPAEKNL